MAIFKAIAEATVYVEKYIDADNIEEAKEKAESLEDVGFYLEGMQLSNGVEIVGCDEPSWYVEYDEYMDRH
jgi:hypothetical protein